jgi:hypothetical protein
MMKEARFFVGQTTGFGGIRSEFGKSHHSSQMADSIL